jgi:hypothetical protein
MIQQTQIGPATYGDGVPAALRGGKQGDGIVSELHGRFYEQNYRGNVYSVGLSTLTSIANATFTSADGLSGTLGTAATATPIIGLWNPLTSGYNAVILQANLQLVLTATTATGPGALMWAVYTGNAGITVGSQQTPVNNKSLLAAGSQMKGLNTLALTGLAAVGNFLRASSLGGGLAINTSVTPANTVAPSNNVENIDGAIVVPPGGILGLFCSTTPAAHSAVGSLTWEEVPV